MRLVGHRRDDDGMALGYYESMFKLGHRGAVSGSKGPAVIIGIDFA